MRLSGGGGEDDEDAGACAGLDGDEGGRSRNCKQSCWRWVEKLLSESRKSFSLRFVFRVALVRGNPPAAKKGTPSTALWQPTISRAGILRVLQICYLDFKRFVRNKTRGFGCRAAIKTHMIPYDESWNGTASRYYENFLA